MYSVRVGGAGKFETYVVWRWLVSTVWSVWALSVSGGSLVEAAVVSPQW